MALEFASGLILGCVLHYFRARPVSRGLGAKFGRKLAKHLISVDFLTIEFLRDLLKDPEVLLKDPGVL